MILNFAKRQQQNTTRKNKEGLARQNSEHHSSPSSTTQRPLNGQHGAASTSNLSDTWTNEKMTSYSKNSFLTTTTPTDAFRLNSATAGATARKLGNNDEEYVTEEVYPDAVFINKFKKVYNDHLKTTTGSSSELAAEQHKASSTSGGGGGGTYKPLPNEFRSYVYDEPSSSKSGLVYTRVKIRQLKYATLGKFVENLSNPETGQLDLNLAQTFLATYRTFTDTPAALLAVRARYEQVLPASLEMTEDVRQEHLKSFRAIVRMWLENYREDFLTADVAMSTSPSASPSMSSLLSASSSSAPVDNINFSLLCDFCHKHMHDSKEIMSLIRAISDTNERSRSLLKSSSSASCIDTADVTLDANNNSIKMSSKEPAPAPAPPPRSQLTKIIPSSSKQQSRLPPSGPSTSLHRRTNSSCTNLNNVPSIVINNSSSTANLANDSVDTLAANMSKTKSLLLTLAASETGAKTDVNNNTMVTKSANDLLGNNLFEKPFLYISSQYFAEQITYLDKCLFENVRAHHCLAGVWNTRYKNNNNNANQKSSSSSSSNNDASLLTSSSSTANLSSPKSTASNMNVSPGLLTGAGGNGNQSINDKFASIRTFIDQFNFVSFMVQATVLENLALKPASRAKIIEKWIEIAIICRKYKNFSSLNAIVQGLNIQCISRLEKTWAEVSGDAKRQFNELAALFSEDENQKLLRETLAKELDTYKLMFNDDFALLKYDKTESASAAAASGGFPTNLKPYNRLYTSPHDKHRMEGAGKYSMGDLNGGINATLSRKMKDYIVKNRIDFRESCGTIPFLGTFLKDLEYIHALGPTKTEQGLINVQLKQKEFEIIDKIRLFQQAAQLYNIKPDAQFKNWLYKQPVYSENQNYELSNKVEPKYDRTNSYSIMTNTNGGVGHRKNKLSVSLNSNGSVESLNSFRDVANTNGANNKTPSSSHSKDVASQRNHHSRSSSYGSSDIFYINGNGANGIGNTASPMIMSQQSYNSANLSNNGGDNLSHGELSISSSNAPMTPNNENSIGKSSSSPLSSTSTYTTNSQKLLVKVIIDFNSNETSKNHRNESVIASTTMYKSIYLKDSDRTKDVKQNILAKFHLDGIESPDNFQLYQVVTAGTGQNDLAPRDELLIKDNCNVFYASKTSTNWQFVLRRRPQNGVGAQSAAAMFMSQSNTSLASNQYDQQHHHSGSPTISQLPRNMSSTSTTSTATTNNNKFSQLPPQSPNHNFSHHQSSHQSANRKKHHFGSSPRERDGDSNNSGGGGWHLFKKILS